MHPERVQEQIIVRTSSQNVVTTALYTAYLHPYRVHHDFDFSGGDARKASRHAPAINPAAFGVETAGARNASSI